MEEKVIRDGKVAVAYSPGFGAGWTTWNDVSPFDPRVIAMIEAGKQREMTDEWCKATFDRDYVCSLGASDLEIAWIPVGTPFQINEYDGSESIQELTTPQYVA